MSAVVEVHPYRPDSAALFAPLAPRPWAMFLDSCGHANGRWDLLVCAPRVTLETRGGITEIAVGGRRRVSRADPFDLVREHLGTRAEARADLPFCGGAVGYLAYDLGRRIERLPVTAADPLGLPEMAVGIYDWALLVDQAEHRTLLVGTAGASDEARALLAEIAGGGPSTSLRPFRVSGPLLSSMDESGYAERFRRARDYIENGDCYQVNLARRFSAMAQGDPWTLYRVLRVRNRAPFSAYLNTPAVRVLCSSPERFLRVAGDRVETCPIKGTRSRSPVPEEDGRSRDELAASPKDRAENLMIVDLLRNDLGKSCMPGSIAVPSLFAVESFPEVHHLVSRITGRLAPGQDTLSLLRGCFPGGSVTGAPKIRAMEIIEELEGERRSIYCGSIVRLGFDGHLDSNIAIRTMIHNGHELRFWAGGAIVADSSCAGEAEEIALKARAMRDVTERFFLDAEPE